ncbi:MAG: beta-mannosidase, partial [Sphingobacteriaceae bacterium]|nr:beta-mannosidase [Cytophagaceae bacterium]
YYRKTVDVPTSARGNHVFLCFDGVDYFSKVWVNDSLVGVHEGMFGGPNAEISRLLRMGGKAEITVEVRAGNWGNRAGDFESLPRNASGERDYSKRGGYNPRASGKIIKPWIISGGSGAEMFFSVGMWGAARLEIVPPFHLERPFLITQSIANGQAKLHLSTELFTQSHSLLERLHPWQNTQLRHPNEHGYAFKPVTEPISLTVEFQSGGKTVFTKEFSPKLFAGRNWLEHDLTLPNPILWHPNGLGAANLYQVRLTLKRSGSVVDKLEFPFGVRTVERLPTAGPRTGDRFENWQFVVNGRKLFVKGMNFTPQDVLLDLPRERYRWTLQAAKNMGVQLIRVWGGGLLETDDFYELCNEMGLMVWQDFPIGNQDTPDYPQDVWEAQVVQNITRLRNHPSLAVWCGGNEFNAYSYGNAATLGVLERNLRTFDPTRLFVRTTPDHGAIHAYPDMDPVWYSKSYGQEAWISETGMHSIPEASLFYELVDNKEFTGLGKMWDINFYKNHSEFIHHFTEYGPGRVPRMLSRASHLTDVTDPTIEAISEASQIGAGEFYQVLSEKVQGNYPVTAGLMPWVFKRHWPVIAIQLMDWFGQAAAPYYFLKRTYEPTHMALDIERLLWNSGETVPLRLSLTHAGTVAQMGTASMQILDDAFKPLWKAEKPMNLAAGPSVTKAELGSFTLPAAYRDRFFFVKTELRDKTGKLISRSVYWPRSTS